MKTAQGNVVPWLASQNDIVRNDGLHFGVGTNKFSYLITHKDSKIVKDIFAGLRPAIIGSIHFIRTSYGDKIRTRMIYETFIMISVACIIFIILQPLGRTTAVCFSMVLDLYR